MNDAQEVPQEKPPEQIQEARERSIGERFQKKKDQLLSTLTRGRVALLRVIKDLPANRSTQYIEELTRLEDSTREETQKVTNQLGFAESSNLPDQPEEQGSRIKESNNVPLSTDAGLGGIKVIETESTSQQEASFEESPTTEELIRERFSPTNTEDNAGFTRAFYHTDTVNGRSISFSFRGVYEEPLFNNHVGISDIGKPPLDTMVPFEHYQEYKSRLEHDRVDQPEHYQTTKDLRGFVALAQILAPENPLVVQASREIEESRYTHQGAIALTEQILASSLIGDNGEPNTRIDQNAEALVLLSFTVSPGAENARKLIAAKVDKLRVLDEKWKKQQVDERKRVLGQFGSEAEREEFDINKHALVRICPVLPEQRNNGDLIFNAQPYVFHPGQHDLMIGNSTHFTIDGVKGDTSGGMWNEYEVAVVAPLGKNFQGVSVFSPADTYWKQYPTEPLVIKHAIIIAPMENGVGQTLEGSITDYNEKERKISYKRGEYIIGDFRQLVEKDAIYGINLYTEEERDWPLEKVMQTVAKFDVIDPIFQTDSLLGNYDNQLQEIMTDTLVSADASQPITQILANNLQEFLESVHPKLRVRDDKTDEYHEASPAEVVELLVTNVTGNLKTKFRDYAIRQALTDLNVQYTAIGTTVGNEGWNSRRGEEEERALKAFALEQGIDVVNHRDSFDVRVRDDILNAAMIASKADPQSETGFSYDWSQYNYFPETDSLLKATPSMRVQVYDAGVINARV